jgi:hypothetical protein
MSARFPASSATRSTADPPSENTVPSGRSTALFSQRPAAMLGPAVQAGLAAPRSIISVVASPFPPKFITFGR